MRECINSVMRQSRKAAHLLKCSRSQPREGTGTVFPSIQRIMIWDGLSRLIVSRKNRASPRAVKGYQILSYICLCLFVGCGNQFTPVETGTAQEALTLMLDRWKEGRKPEILRDESPSIEVQEMDWSRGAKLLEYEIVSDDQPARDLSPGSNSS